MISKTLRGRLSSGARGLSGRHFAMPQLPLPRPLMPRPDSLHATSVPFHSNLAKRKPSADPYPVSTNKDKISPGEAMGLVMISHGEDVMRAGVGERAYGEALEKFGRARCKIAMVREMVSRGRRPLIQTAAGTRGLYESTRGGLHGEHGGRFGDGQGVHDAEEEAGFEEVHTAVT